MPMKSSVAGGVSPAIVWNPTPPSTKPAARMVEPATAKQFAFDKSWTAVCEVVVKLL